MLDTIYNWFKSAPVEKGTTPAFNVDEVKNILKR